MFSATLPPGWQAFERLQHSIDSRIVTSIALGADEALSDLLDDFAKEFAPTAEHVERRFRSLRRNRMRKQRRRASLLFHAARAKQVAARSTRIDDADELQSVQYRLTPAEWVLFRRVASGDAYHEIARENGLSPGQLRTRVCRLRVRLQLAA